MPEPTAPSICFVVGELFGVSAVGGGERQIALLAKGLAEQGFAISLVARRPPAGAEASAVAGAWPYGPCRWYEGTTRRREGWITGIRTAVSESRADVVYQRGMGPLTVGAALGASDSGAGLVVGGSSDADADGFLARFARSMHQRRIDGRSPWSAKSFGGAVADGLLQARSVSAARSADAVVAQTEGQARLLAARLGEATVVRVVRSVAPEVVPRELAPRRMVLWIGADKPVKRPHLFREIVRLGPATLEYVMVGKGLTPAAAVPGVSPEVRGALDHDDVLGLMSEAVVVVNTSTIEGFPNTFLEAWSRGAPVLSLGVDPDGVVTGSSLGWVCEDAAAASTVLRSIAEDTCEAVARGEAGAGFVRERYSAERSVGEHAALLRAAAETAGARRAGR